MKTFLEDIREQIAKGRIDFGLNQLHHALSTFEPDDKYKKEERRELERDLTIFSHENNSIQIIGRGGTSSREDLDLKENNLIDRVLNLLNEITPQGRFPYFAVHTKKIVLGQNEEDAWLQASRGSSMTSFQNYLQNYPDGQFSATAKRIIEVLQKNEDTRKFFQGAVLYGKIRGFLSLDREEQILDLIEKKVIQEYVVNDPSIKLVFFSGGNFALFFKKLDENSFTTTLKAFLLGIYIQLLPTTHDPNFRIGITLDWENDAKSKEVNQHYYLQCKALDVASLYMSFSDKEHFFLSNQVFVSLNRKLNNIGKKLSTHSNLMELLEAEFKNEQSRTEPFFTKILHDIKSLYSSSKLSSNIDSKIKIEPFNYYDKSKSLHSLHNFYAVDSKLQIGKQYTPYHWTFLEKRDDPVISPRQRFIKKLAEADKVCIIGITHEETTKFLEEALKERGNKFWDELQIVFPNIKIIEAIKDKRDIEIRKNRWEGAKRSLFLFLIEQTKDQGLNNWQCLEFDGNIPFIGNKLIGKNSVIRIAPILPGEDAKDVFYIEIPKKTDAFNQLEKTFNRVCELSRPLTERLVYGALNPTGNNIVYKGLVERKNYKNFTQESADENFYFPVVLVMLHTQKFGGKRYSILQKRTELNATEDIGKYSNISGRLIDLDVLRSSSNANLVHQYLESISKILPHSHEKNQDADIDEKKSAFEDMLKQENIFEISLAAWKQAAIREIREELGLFIDESRLEFQEIAPPLPKKGYSLFFTIFSLDLNPKELESISKLRPDASLKLLSLYEIEALWHQGKSNDLKPREQDNDKSKTNELRLNDLLHNNFEGIFKPIFEKLGI
ncbi:MAG: NUDIX hydrolase [Lewinellaceae bacterium]|nr:NUDIX hydrolase [Lewinellaceae bacterium]